MTEQMTSFEQLDAYLARDFNPDYWYDDAYSFAMQWIAEFTSADWVALRASALCRPPDWQQRCAYALIGSPATASADLLLQMAGADDDAISWTAVSALKALRWNGVHPQLAPTLDERLTRLARAKPMALDAIDWLRQYAQETAAIKN